MSLGMNQSGRGGSASKIAALLASAGAVAACVAVSGLGRDAQTAGVQPSSVVKVAGTGGVGTGLAFRIQEAGYRLNIARMFAALAIVAAMGVFIFAALSLLSHMLLRKWHESAIKREY